MVFGGEIVDSLALPATFGVVMVSAIGVANVAGKFVFGAAAERYGVATVVVLGGSLLALGTLSLPVVPQLHSSPLWASCSDSATAPSGRSCSGQSLNCTTVAIQVRFSGFIAV
jgi:hypothetical protein